MKLYHRADCPFCWKVRIILGEIDMDIDEIAVDYGVKHPDVMALNPGGTVPVLVDGDLILTESAVIAEYLAESFPASDLMAATPAARAKVRQIHSISDNRIGKILFPYIKQVREGAATDRLKQSTIEAWGVMQKMLANLLGNGDFFGPKFSLADCALIPRFALALAYGLTLSDEFQSLKNWFRRCAERPSFAATLPAVFPGIEATGKLEFLQV